MRSYARCCAGAEGGAAVFYGEHSWFPLRHICTPLSHGSPASSSGRLRSRAPGLLLAQALGDPESSELPLMPHSALSSPLLNPRGGTPAPPRLPGPLVSSLRGESGDLPRGRRVPGIPPLPREVSQGIAYIFFSSHFLIGQRPSPWDGSWGFWVHEHALGMRRLRAT